MVKLFSIQVPQHEWGAVFQKDFPIKDGGIIVGVCCNVLPVQSSATVMPRVGMVSLSSNNTDVVHSSIPAYIINKCNTKGISAHTVGVDFVPTGSMLRVIIEEADESPFVNENNAYHLKVYVRLRKC